MTKGMRAVYVAAAVFAVVYIALDLNKLYALRYGADLGTYLQTLVNLRHGSSWNFGEWRPHFQVHDSWALIFLVPIVALWPRAETLIVLQVVAVAAAAIPLALLARALRQPQGDMGARAASLLGIAYLLSPSTQGLCYDNFSENVFVPLVAFSGVFFARQRLFWPAMGMAALLAGLKEDEILFLLWLGGACALWWDRRIGIGIAAIAIATAIGFIVVERVAGVHPNLPPYGLAIHDLSGKLSMIAFLLVPFAFAPLAVGWRLLLGAPMLAEIVFMQPGNYEPSRVGSHYTAPLLAATAVAAAFGVQRYAGFARAMIPLGIVATLFFNDTVLHVGRWPYIVDPIKYARAAELRDAPVTVEIPRFDEGVWAVAAANPQVRLNPRPGSKSTKCPAYNTNGAAFFANLTGKLPPRLCGGVALP